jgi:hypothetical protein
LLSQINQSRLNGGFLHCTNFSGLNKVVNGSK